MIEKFNGIIYLISLHSTFFRLSEFMLIKCVIGTNKKF